MFSPFDEFDKNDTFKMKSSKWTPEFGYETINLENDQDKYPRPGVGEFEYKYLIRIGGDIMIEFYFKVLAMNWVYL